MRAADRARRGRAHPDRSVTRRIRQTAAALLVVCAALFTAGVAAEDDTHAASTENAETPDEAHDEGAEGPHPESGHDESDEDEGILGIDVESRGAVALAVAVSVALAVGLWIREERWLAVTAGVVAAVFVVFDVVEVAHQVDESQTGLAVLAGVIAAGHLSVAVAAGLSTTRVS